MSINLTQNKRQFVELLQSTEREGVDDLIVDLEKMGFFTAPVFENKKGNKGYWF